MANDVKYLLLHRSGAIACTPSLDESLNGITAVINLSTLEIFDGEQWEKLPVGLDSLIEAEEEEEGEEEQQEDDEEEYVTPLSIQTGAKRIFDPHTVWAYARSKF